MAVTLVAGAGWACATTGGGGAAGVSLSASRYSAEEMAALPYDDLYNFFRAHNQIRMGQTGAQTPIGVRYQGELVSARLYVNDSEAGNPISLLRQTSPADVASLTIRDPDEASSIYGGQGTFAVISVEMK